MPQQTGFRDYPCDLCGADQPIEIPHCRLYTAGQAIHICGECGFVYVRARRSSEEIARVWADEIYGGVYTAVKNPAVIARQTFVAEFLATHSSIEGKKVCDVGAGEGYFLKYLQDQYGVSGFGIEPSTANCARLRKLGVESFDGTIEQFVASEGARSYRADVVTVMWTLENCLSCIEMLKGAASLVAVGGRVLVATGSRILVPFKKPLFQYFSHTPADSHCFRFSANALKTALALAGLKTVATNRYLDNDILCVLAEKTEPDAKLELFKDRPLEVLSFFERWHTESVHYVRDWAQ